VCASRAELIRDVLVLLAVCELLFALLTLLSRVANGRRSKLAKLLKRVEAACAAAEPVDTFDCIVDSFVLLLLLVDDAIMGMMLDVLISGDVTEEDTEELVVCVDCTL
jgi:hypothetical protein